VQQLQVPVGRAVEALYRNLVTEDAVEIAAVLVAVRPGCRSSAQARVVPQW
jgi:hypothetical protein